MDDVADRLDQASDALSALSRDVPTLAVAPGVFAALPALSPAGDRRAAGTSASDLARLSSAGLSSAGLSSAGLSSAGLSSAGLSSAGPGMPAQVGRALHDHWIAVLEARSREASVAAARLAEMARSVRAARRHYAETDEAVERRFTQEL